METRVSIVTILMCLSINIISKLKYGYIFSDCKTEGSKKLIGGLKMSESSNFYDELNKDLESGITTPQSDKEKRNFRSLRDYIDVEFSHNEVIGIWARDKNDLNDHLVYRGEAWAIPDEYLDLTAGKYIGLVPENRWEGGTINILVKEHIDSIVCGLPKKKHNTSECVDGGKNEC